MDIVRKSCFVIAPAELPVGPFLEQLRQEGVEPFFISDFLKRPGSSVSQTRSAFKTVDFIIAFLAHSHSLPNLYFEIGFAMGVGRPLLAFASPGVQIPVDLVRARIKRIDLSNLANVLPDIQAFLAPKEKSEIVGFAETKSESSRPRPRLRGANLKIEVARVRGLLRSGQFSEAESALSKLLSDVGWTVVEARPNVRTRAPDLAVWIDEVEKEIGNPIAVEVRSSLEPIGLDAAVAQLSRYLSNANAKAGIVLYGGPPLRLQQRNIAQSSPPIFAFSFDELADLIETEKFPATLKASLASAKRVS